MTQRATLARLAALLCAAVLCACSSTPPPPSSAAARPRVAPASYDEAFRVWSLSKGDADERAYGDVFLQFNKQRRFDNAANCQDLGPETVRMLLVIDRADRGIVVTRALTANDSLKARCIQDVYRGITPPLPPYTPFIVQMDVA